MHLILKIRQQRKSVALVPDGLYQFRQEIGGVLQFVKQDHGAIFEVVDDGRNHLFRRFLKLPVHRSHAPHDRNHVQSFCRFQRIVIELAERGTKIFHIAPSYEPDLFDAVLDVIVLFGIRESRQIVVLDGMRADLMAFRQNALPWPRGVQEAALPEKDRLHIRILQSVKNARQCPARAVIKCQNNALFAR